MLARKIDGDGATERMPVDRDVSRRDVPLCHQILPCALRVLVHQPLTWRSACAFTISAVIEDEDVQPGPAEAQHVVHVGGHVGRVAMQIEQGFTLRVLRRNPPTRKLIVLERKRDLVELHAQVGRRDIDDPAGMEEDLRLRVPDCTHRQEVYTRDRGKQDAGDATRTRPIWTFKALYRIRNGPQPPAFSGDSRWLATFSRGRLSG